MYSRAHAQAKGVLNSFVQFVGWMGRDGLELTGASLASRLERHCGRPCRYDYLLRTESLAADWLRLVEALGLPRHALPRVNEANDLGRWGKAPATEHTAGTIRFVNRAEAPVFEEFGYSMRQPFE